MLSADAFPMPNIRQLRTSAGLTQQQLAEMAGISRSQLAEIEGGAKPANTLRLAAIAEALGVTVGDLFLTEQEAAILKLYREKR